MYTPGGVKNSPGVYMSVITEAPAVSEDCVLISEAARILGVSIYVVKDLSNRGKLPTARTPEGHRLYRRADVEQLAEERRLNPPKNGRPRKQSQTEPSKERTKT